MSMGIYYGELRPNRFARSSVTMSYQIVVTLLSVNKKY